MRNKFAVHSVQKPLASHYGTAARQQLRKLQKLVCKVAQEGAIRFIAICTVNCRPLLLFLLLFRITDDELSMVWNV